MRRNIFESRDFVLRRNVYNFWILYPQQEIHRGDIRIQKSVLALDHILKTDKHKNILSRSVVNETILTKTFIVYKNTRNSFAQSWKQWLHQYFKRNNSLPDPNIEFIQQQLLIKSPKKFHLEVYSLIVLS